MKSFVFAFRGIMGTIKTERNMRVHLCFAFYVIIAGFVTHISAGQWTAVLICMGIVTSLECFNTAMESLCDTVHPEKADGIRIAKDASAGAVLCAAIASVIVGGSIFFRADKLAAALEFYENRTALSIAVILTLIPLAVFVRGGKRDKNEK
ncbi:MAG: diacylglycerol kinase family protein [Oscillospiraceae bacterium]|nr:diacylglycerol kinase family protein [Oscillospiraceae bacterium]